MCTQARLVQGGQASEWQGMPMSNGSVPAMRFKVAPDEPAYLEVTVDPAAHGEQGIGFFRRGITVRTNDGLQLDFILSGNIVR